MKFFTPVILLAAGLTAAAPTTTQEPRQSTPGPYHITEFFASKVHNSASCSYSFTVSAPSLSGGAPVNCTGNGDSGWSGSWWLANIYAGQGKCDDPSVTWEFYQRQAFEDTNATFIVTVDGAKGTYIIPKEDISVRENGPTPFDDDVYYSGPRAFDIVDFESE